MDNTLLEVLKELETLRKKHENKDEPSDWVFRICQAAVAKKAGYNNRVEWVEDIKILGGEANVSLDVL